MTNKSVIITGGNKGIGLACTQRFLSAGYKVTIIARDNNDVAKETLDRVTSIDFDLTQLEKLDELIANIDCDILINNAGLMHGKSFSEYSPEMRDEIMCINLYTPIKLIELIGKKMAERGGGRIVNNASIAGQIGHPDVWYGASKAGLINATKSFAKIFGPAGVVINGVAASPVETAMLDTIPEARKTAIKNSVITGRFAKPEEVAETIFWLSTTSPEYINGFIIDLNNGFFPR